MPDLIVEISTPAGVVVGNFINPKIEMLSEHIYQISGRFIDADGGQREKIEFNPEALPYTANLPPTANCAHAKLVKVYVQRGRQPVQMTGTCSD